eukprot:TRINITY_DN12233_c0_g1_i2.p1 TRINITY_DN12233_c0_g1~~TRINITY_DN12233_c0_g1_i2.p1  ORF type:complete len:432 (+),score=71.70 TRINITY_DN12233_c0_g1_i2:132-1427(+)
MCIRDRVSTQSTGRTSLDMQTSALIATLVAGLVVCNAHLVTVSNNEPKKATDGSIVTAHDGTYRFIDGYYWYHGAEYGMCQEPPKNGCDQTPDHCGFHPDHNVSIWRSKDLSSGSWEFVGRAAHCATDIPNCHILYRPHLVYNPSTLRYVLFVNYVTKDNGYGGNAVFTADHPAGPFGLANPQMNLSRLCPGPYIPEGQKCGAAQGGCGDFDIIVDPKDNAAYIIYGCNFYMSVEKLSSDYLYSGGINATVSGGLFEGNSAFPEYFVEAPAFFQRNGLFYALFGHCCCFCQQGSGVMVYTASSPLGPWTPQCSDVQAGTGCLAASGDLACVPSNSSLGDGVSIFGGEPTAGQGCNYNGKPDKSTMRAQQNFVIAVKASDGSEQFVWTGDRWQQAPDGTKAHEGQTWSVLEFGPTGTIMPIVWQDTIQFDVA